MAEKTSGSYAYDSLIFDIDGTLWNAAASTAVAWTEVFSRRSIPITVSTADIEGVAGRPYLDCLRIIFKGFDLYGEKEGLLSDLAVAEKSKMQEMGGTLYPDVKEGLEVLSTRFPMFLVSNCQDWYLDAFLEYRGLGSFFRDSTCHGKTKLKKSENIRIIMDRHSLKSAVYIGDTSGDHQSATQAGIDYLHVSYGFEPSHPAPLVFNDFNSIVRHLAR